MTTRPHTDDRPSVDAGDDDELWVQVACRCPDPNGPDVVGRPRPGRDRRGRVRRDAPIARGTRRCPSPTFSSGHRAATYLPGTFLRGQPTPHPVAFVRGEGVVGALAAHGAAGADAFGQAYPQPKVLPLFLLRRKKQLMVAELTRGLGAPRPEIGRHRVRT